MGDEFELTVLDSGQAASAIAFARYGSDTAIEALSNLDLTRVVQFYGRLSDTAAGRAPLRPTASELADFGRQLFALLVQGKVKSIYERLPDTHIRLQIYSNRADLQAIPWEYIQQPDAVPGPNAFRTIVRVIPTIGVAPPNPRKLDGPIRMLFVYAEPPRGPSVGWPLMKATIESQFRQQPQLSQNFSLTVVEGANTVNFQNAFVDAEFDILHIVCHGKVANGTGSLVFQNTKGDDQDEISAIDLANFLKNKKLALIVLSSCNTSAGDFSKQYATIAKTLVENGIPAVIANQFEIQNTLAATFANAFYAELRRSGDVDRATAAGRLSLGFGPTLPNNVARIDWGIPTLYRHLDAARIFQA